MCAVVWCGGNFTIVKLLLNSGSDVKMVTDDGETTLHLAVVGGSIECVELMLQHHPPLINMKDERGITALHAAAVYGQFEIVKLLLNCESDVKMVDDDGKTALELTQCDDCKKELKK